MANFSKSGMRVGLVILVLVALAGAIIYAFVNNLIPSAEVQQTPAAIIANTPTPTVAPPTKTATPVPTTTPQPSATATSAVPPGGIVYVLEPDINSVGLVREGQEGNLFGESPLLVGLREGKLNIGAMQFDLSFILDGSTIFMGQLELVGLDDKGLTSSSNFAVTILSDDMDEKWSQHNFDALRDAPVAATLKPDLEAGALAKGSANTITLNAAQRSIIEDRLKTNAIAFRIDSLFPEGWFAWDSGYGAGTQGQRPRLRLGVLPPAATEAAVAPPNSTPTPTATFILVTSTPEPENVLTVAAEAPTATYQAQTTGTPTLVPDNWVTPWIITVTPTPENGATAQYIVAEATAFSIAYGSPTPLAQNMVTATPTATGTPTPIFILLEGDLPPQTATPTPVIAAVATPPIPAPLIGKIAFKSDRSGEEEIYVINSDGTGLALLTNPWPYNMARLADQFSPDGQFRVFTKDGIRYRNEGGQGVRDDAPAIYWYNIQFHEEQQVTRFGSGLAYDGVWSPTADRIAFLSNDSSDDEIWVVDWNGENLQRLTETNEAYNAREIGKDTFVPEVNGHPSWSPDGKQIVFWSNRENSNGIWVMNADGSNVYGLSKPQYSDWAPVWIKYPGIPGNTASVHIPYTGSFDPRATGDVYDCADFPDKNQAQAFYLAAGGPAMDPNLLDADFDGQACEVD